MTSVSSAPVCSPSPNNGAASPTPASVSPVTTNAEEGMNSPENLIVQENGPSSPASTNGVNLSVKSESNNGCNITNTVERKESSSSAMSPPSPSMKDNSNHSPVNHRLTSVERLTSVDKLPSRPLRLRRVNHSQEMVSGFRDLLKSESLTDVLLSCQGGVTVKAHRVILSTFSPYFKSVFESHPFSDSPWMLPVVVLKDFGVLEVKAIVEFIYRGEVSVPRDRLASVLEAARALEVSGLADLNPDNFEGKKETQGVKDTVNNSLNNSANNSLNNTSLAALKSLNAPNKRSLIPSSVSSSLSEEETDNSMMANVMAKRLRTCLERNGLSQASPNPFNASFSNHALNLSASSDRSSPVTGGNNSSSNDYLCNRLPASLLGQLVQHQMLQKKVAEQQMTNQSTQQTMKTASHASNHQRSNNLLSNNLKQQILQQQLLRAKTMRSPSMPYSPSQLMSGGNQLSDQLQRLRQVSYNNQSIMREEEEDKRKGNYEEEDDGEDSSSSTDKARQDRQTSIHDYEEEDKDSIFHRQQQLRLQQLQKQQHQYALQMQLETQDEERLLDYQDNDDSETGFDWQEGFTDDVRDKQLQIANINSNSKNNSPQTVQTPDFLQPRGPGRPRKGNKAQEISPCPECNKVFVRPDVLKLHYRSVHLNERHPCNLCPKIFKWPGDLSKHKRTKHPDKYPSVNAQ